MATLAAQIETNYAVRVGAKTRVNVSQAGGSVQQTVDATRQTAICADAATWVQEAVGSTDGDDTEAVALGVRWAVYLGKHVYTDSHDQAADGEEQRLLDARERLAEQRRQHESTPVISTNDSEEDDSDEDE